jgi:hypothetical protein
MKWLPAPAWIALPVLSVAAPTYAMNYLGVQQLQADYFPGQVLQPVAVTLSAAQRDLIRALSGISAPFDADGIWRASAGGWLITDHVLGKHEQIAFAVILDARGAVVAVEIMSYSESYGSEVRGKDFRAQFVGKRNQDPLALGKDIRNISGATLSCKHVTQGVKRVLAVYEIALGGMVL